MSTLKRASKNIFFKAVAEIASRLIYLLFFIYMARRIGADDFGLFSFAFFFAGIFTILVDPGLNILLTRDVARDQSLIRKYSNNILTIKLFLSIIVFILLWALIELLGYDHHTVKVVLAMGAFLILNCFLDFFVSISSAYERMELDAAIRVANKLLVTIFGVIALFIGSKIIGLIFWMAAGSTMSILFGYYVIRRGLTRINIESEWKFLAKIFFNALPMGLTMIFSIIYFRIDIVMLSMFGISNKEIGFYSAAVKLIEVLNVIPAILVGGIFPVLADFSEKSKTELESTFKKTYQVLLLIAIPIVVSTSVLSGGIIDVIYGRQYENSVIALKILIWTSLFIFLNVLLSNLIVVVNRQKLNALFSCLCLILNIILNLILIPRYGFIGAGIATVATDMALFILSITFVIKYFKNIRLLKDSLKPLGCGAVLGLLLIYLNGLKLLFVIPVAVITYLILIVATRTLLFEDLMQVKKVLIRG